MSSCSFLITCEEAYQRTGMMVRAKRHEETTDLLLKEHNQGQHSHTDQLIKDGAEQLHLEHLRHHQPNQDEHQDTRKDIDRTRCLHQLVAVVQQESHRQDVYKVFYAKLEKHNLYDINNDKTIF